MVSRDAAERFGVTESGGVRPSIGAGISLFWDLVRVDAARGLDNGEWEWMVSVNPAWRAPL
jgi:adenine deaminase